jgi:serine/threonine-protein kinase
VGALVERLAHDTLAARAERVSSVERISGDLLPHDSEPPPPSLALQAPQQTGMAQRPMELGLDEPGTGGTPITNTPISTVGMPPRPPEEEKGISTPWLIVLCASAFLAVVGAGLGGFALLNRRAPPPTPSAHADPTPPPTHSLAPSTSVAPIAPLAEAGASSSGIESASTDAGAESTSGKDKPAPSALASAPPRQFVPWTPPKPPKKREGCDPPYTTDDVGHKHYKPECFDTP